MEEQILKILQDKVYFYKGDVSVKTPLNDTAKEIADHFREFIEWFHYECGDQKYLQINDEPKKYITRVGAIYKTLDELYEYWWNNIKI